MPDESGVAPPETVQAQQLAAEARQASRDQLIAELEDLLPRLRRFARSMTSDWTYADDLVQSALERALACIHLFQLGANFRAWLFTILRNCMINDQRRQRETYYDDITDSILEQPAPPSQDDTLTLRDLKRALEHMNDDMREALLLVTLEGFSYAQAAEVLGLCEGTIKSRVCRGRAFLKEQLDGQPAATLIRVSAA